MSGPKPTYLRSGAVHDLKARKPQLCERCGKGLEPGLCFRESRVEWDAVTNEVDRRIYFWHDDCREPQWNTAAADAVRAWCRHHDLGLPLPPGLRALLGDGPAACYFCGVVRTCRDYTLLSGEEVRACFACRQPSAEERRLMAAETRLIDEHGLKPPAWKDEEQRGIDEGRMEPPA